MKNKILIVVATLFFAIGMIILSIYLNNVNKVEISIEGNKELKFRDKYELTTLYERNLDLVQ